MSAGALVATVVLLLANAFFVAVEFALIASRRTKIEAMADEGNIRARVGLSAIRDLNPQLAGAQLGITIASLLLGAIAEPAFADLVESSIEPFAELPSGLLHGVSFAVGLTIVVFLHMVVGEMIPKNIAIAQPERTLLLMALPNRAYVTLFRPVIRVLNLMANAITRLLGVEPRDELETAHTADEIAVMLGQSRQEGLIEDVAHQLMTGALDLGGRPLTSVVVPRDGIVWVPRDATPADAERIVVESGHSRLLVAGQGLDDVLGFIHAKDLLTLSAAARELPLPLGRIRRMLVLKGDATLEDALFAMQRARLHVAVVRDAGGSTLGIATLEDVLEALVGDIRDESDVSGG